MERADPALVRSSPQIRQELYAEEMFGSAALVVVGEPTSDEHKNAILERVTQGFGSWDSDATGCDITAELASISSEAPCGVAGDNGEHVIKHGSDEFQLEIIVNPRKETLANGLRLLLLPPTKHKHIIFAGYSFTGTGDWVLQDGTWSFSDLVRVFKQADVALALDEQKDSTLTIHCGPACGHWTQERLQKSVIGQQLKVSLSPEKKQDDLSSVVQFATYLSCFVKVASTHELLETSEIVGNIRFSKPALYVFPAAQGDCAVFGVGGFNMLLDGGFSRRSCFWEFTKHLDRLDVLLISRINQDNLFGMKSFLSRHLQQESLRRECNLHPEITYSFFNHTAPTKDCGTLSSLGVSLVEEASLVSSFLKKIGCKPGMVHASPTPVQLFHKIGHGTLDMYVLNPSKESADYKEMMKQWSNTSDHFTNNKAGVPLPDSNSLAALLVWKSHSGELARILYPGSTPQADLLKGIEMLKNLEVFKHPGGSKTASAAKAPKHSAYVAKTASKEPTPPPVDEVPPPLPARDFAVPDTPEKEEPVVSLQEAIPPPPEDIADPVAEELQDAPARGDVHASTPRDAWVDRNEPVSLPEPGNVDYPLMAENVSEPAATNDAKPDLVNQLGREHDIPPFNEVMDEPEFLLSSETSAAGREGEVMDSTMGDVAEEISVDEGAVLMSSEQDNLVATDEEGEGDMAHTAGEPVPVKEEPVDEVHGNLMESHPEESMHDQLPPGVSDSFDDMTSPVDIPHAADMAMLKEDGGQLVDVPHHTDDQQNNFAGFDMPQSGDNSTPTEEVVVPEEEPKTEAAFSAADFVASDDMPAPNQFSAKDGVTSSAEEDESADEEMAAEEELHEKLAGDELIADVDAPAAADVPVSANLVASDEFSSADGLSATQDALPSVADDTPAVTDGLPADETPTIADSLPTDETPTITDDLPAHDTPTVTDDLPAASDHFVAPADNLAAFSDDFAAPTEPVAAHDLPATDGLLDAEDLPAASDDMPSATDDLPASDQATLEAEVASEQAHSMEAPAEAPVDLLGAEIAAEPSASSAAEPSASSAAAHSQDDTEIAQGTSAAMLMSNSQEELYRNMAAGRDLAAEEQAGQPGPADSHQIESEAQLDQQASDDEVAPADRVEHAADPMTQSFLDESTVGEPADPMAGSFIDESTVGRGDEGRDNLQAANAITSSFEESSRADVDDIMSRSLILESSTPAAPPAPAADSTDEAPAFGEEGTPAAASLPTDLTEDSVNVATPVHMNSASHLNPLAPIFTPIRPTIATGPPSTSDSQGGGELLSGWGDRDCTGCQSQEPHSHSPPLPETAGETAVFDPLREWGEPQQLPLPPSPTPMDTAAASGSANSAPAAQPTEKKKMLPKANGAKSSPKTSRPAGSAAKATAKPSATDKKPAASGLTRKPLSAPSRTATKKSAGDAASKRPANAEAKSLDNKAPTKPARSGLSRPAKSTAPAAKADKPSAKPTGAEAKKPLTKPTRAPADKVEKAKPSPKVKSNLSRPKTAPSRASASSRSAPATGRSSAKAVIPFHVDLAFVPHHGESKYVGMEYFQHIHARYYVFSGLNSNVDVYNALLAGKESWHHEPVTIIPTYNTTEFNHWLVDNREQLGKLNIDVAMSAADCVIRLTESGSSFPAFRIEF